MYLIFTWGFVQVGFAAITTAEKLPYKAIIHAVGPRMGEGDENNKLRKAVRSSLVLASEKYFRSISMPAISSGIFGLNAHKTTEMLHKDQGEGRDIFKMKMINLTYAT